MRVVVIDDSKEIREVLRYALDREDEFSVVAEAADGLSGIEAVSVHQPHLVLLDIGMPEMDGLQALPRIREESPGSIVIMLTGWSESSGALDAVELGAHGYIRKGGGISGLLSQIREVLAHRFSVLERRGEGPTREPTP